MKNKVSILFISDTHSQHKKLRNLPPADVIVHCGDISSMGYEMEVIAFMKWFSNLDQFKYKIFISGNHDFLFERNSALAKSLIADNVIYLEDSGVDILGYHFYGSPVQLPFNNWAFNKEEYKLKEHWEGIPDNTDVLITHCPPYGIGDYVPYNHIHIGSPSLYKEVTERVKPLIHGFGHCHEGRGITKLDNTTLINASNLDDNYYVVFNPILVEIENEEVNVINK